MKYRAVIPGFTLIEVLIAVAISAILAGMLYRIVGQAQRLLGSVERTASLDTRIALFHERFGLDITGAFIPGKSPKPLDKIFFSENDGTNLKKLTCITCNPMQVYGKGELYRPRIARVTYEVRASTQFPGALTLYRKESTALACCDKEGRAREYELVDNIKSLAITYQVLEPKENKWESFDYWSTDEQEQSDKNKNVIRIPQYALVTITLWADTQQTRDTSCTLRYPIYWSLGLNKQEKSREAVGTVSADSKDKS